jgi:hypothetical protein
MTSGLRLLTPDLYSIRGSLIQYEQPMKKVCKENPRIQLIGERNRCDIQIQVKGFSNLV